MSKVKSILEGSKCHSLDRHDWRAQNDVCGYGYYYPDGWNQGVTEHFKLTHWPYVNEKFINRCMRSLSKNSPENLVLGAITLSTSLAASLVVLLL
jgi:hypothetical protein